MRLAPTAILMRNYPKPVTKTTFRQQDASNFCILILSSYNGRDAIREDSLRFLELVLNVEEPLFTTLLAFVLFFPNN